MAFQLDSKGRPIYYDVDRMYDQAGFNEMILGLSQQDSISRIDTAAIQDDLDFRQRYAAAQQAQGDNPMDWAIQQESMQRYGGAPGTLPTQDFQQHTDPQTGETYFTRRLMSGGPGARDNTFRLGEEFGTRGDQDWYLQATYNADGSLRDIAPAERINQSGWVQFRDAIKPVAIMAAMAYGGYLANAAQAGAGAAGGATGGASTAAGGASTAAGAQPGLAQWAASQGITSAPVAASTIPGAVSTSQALLSAGGVAGTVPGLVTGNEALQAMITADRLAAATGAVTSGETAAAGGGIIDRISAGLGAAGDFAPLAALAGGAATLPEPQAPVAPVVPGAEAPPEARGYQAARDPIIDVLNRNRRQGRNSTMLTGYGGVSMDSVRTGGNTLLGL